MSETIRDRRGSGMTEEEEKRYETKLGLREKHEKFLRIMCRFDALCRKYGIRYSLSDGTMIGAVRHQGFIPWDDDADLLITRAEYRKLREAVKTENDIYLFRIGCLDRITIPEYLDEHLYVDLFIIDAVPVSGWKFRVLRYKCGFLRSWFLNIYELGNSSHTEKSRKIIEPVLYRLARLFVGKRDIFDLYDSLFDRDIPHNSYTKFTETMESMSHWYPNRTFDEGYTDVLFCGRKLMQIKNADLMLKELYGDYMQLPPEEKRHPEHTIDMMSAPKDCIRWYNRAT